jgi:hypothetical protein
LKSPIGPHYFPIGNVLERFLIALIFLFAGAYIGSPR